MKNSKFRVIFAPEIIDIINQVYPRWERRMIKRKYKNKHAVYMDYWIPIAPKLYDLLPKVKMGPKDFQIRSLSSMNTDDLNKAVKIKSKICWRSKKNGNKQVSNSI